MVRQSWFRGILTLSVLAMFAAAMFVSNAGAVAEKKEATKKSVNLLKSQLGATEASKDAVAPLETSQTVILSLPLQAGNYALIAKTVISNVDGGADPDVRCELRAGGALKDAIEIEVSDDVPSSALATLTAVHRLASPGPVELSCNDEGVGTNAEATYSKITTIEVP